MKQRKLIWREVDDKQTETCGGGVGGRQTKILSVSTAEVYPLPFLPKRLQTLKKSSRLVQVTFQEWNLSLNSGSTSSLFLPSPTPANPLTTCHIQASVDIALSPGNDATTLLTSPVLIARHHRKANLGALGGARHARAPQSWHPLLLLREAGGGTCPSKPGICHLRAKDELIELR